MDISPYFERIGYRGPAATTLDTLRELHWRHPRAIAFENLDALRGVTAGLDTASLLRKLVHEGRGGWCFEHNLLFAAALRALGFPVRQLAARVLWNAPPDAVRPRSHMLLLVETPSGRHLADVGFGGLTLTAPLAFEPGVTQQTPHEPFRIVADGEDFVIEAAVQDAWKPLYRFDLQAQLLPDYELANWYLSNHPSSHFRHNLMAARADTDGRYALLNGQLTVRRTAGRSEKRQLASVDELRDVLTNVFGIRLPDDGGLARVLRAAMLREPDQTSTDAPRR